MKRDKKQAGFLFFLVVVILCLALTACSSRHAERSPGQGQQQPQGQEKIPDELKEIKSSLEQLNSQLEEKKELQDDPQKLQQLMTQKQGGGGQGAQQGQGGQQGQEKQQQNGEQGQQGGGGQGNQQSQQGQQQPQISPLKDWSKEEEQVTSLHEKWNGFEPKAVKSGVNSSEINGFEEKLDELTLAIKGQNIQTSLLAVNQAYKYIPGFMEIFEQENPPDVYRMRYEINEIIYNAESGKWPEAGQGMNELKQTWPKVRLKLRTQDADLAEKFDFAVNDLERILTKQNQELVKIKGKIALDNLKQVEEKLKQVSQQGGQQGGQKKS